MATDPAKPCLRFGPYLLDLPARRLLRGQSPVRLGGRALDLLAALLETPGQIVARDTLVRRVWPASFVEESSLRVHIAALRRALDEDDGAPYISTVPGQGYGFMAPVVAEARDQRDQRDEREGREGRDEHDAHDERGKARAAAAPVAIPRLDARAASVRADPLIGREADLVALAPALGQYRLLTLVGAGGIGKTRVALALADREARRFPDGCAVIDLSPVADAAALPSTVAARLGLMAPGADPVSALTHGLRDRRALLVLDNCEHLLDAVHALAQALLAHTGALCLLATSREPLGVDGELAWPLPPLATESPNERPSPAARLFLERAERAGAALQGLNDLPRIDALCRRLDGLPLALELAAARLPALGLPGLVQRLDVVLAGSIGAPQGASLDSSRRHRSLEALIDWSDSLLAAPDRAVLRRLSVFRQDFSPEDAIALAADAEIPPERAALSLRRLVRKSLLTPVEGHEPPRLRLLFATRAYAERRLAASPEQREWAARHARHIQAQLVRAGRELQAINADRLSDWHRRHAGLIDELRAAVARNLAPGGDARAALSVITAARPLILEFGLFAEAMPWVERGLTLVATLEPPDLDLELQLRICACFLGIVAGRGGARREEMVDRLLALARRPGQGRSHRRAHIDALFVLVAAAWGLGEHRRMAPWLDELRTLLPGGDGSPSWVLIVRRHQATLDFFDGRFDEARRHLDAVLALSTRHLRRSYTGAAPLPINCAQYTARILWLQGRGEEADALIDATLEQLDPLTPLAPGMVLGMTGIPVAIWQGRDDLARERLDRLYAHVTRHRQGFWPPLLDSLRWALDERRQRDASPGAAIPDAPANPPPPWPSRLVEDQLGTFGLPWVSEASVRRAWDGDVGWAAAELIRADAALRLVRLDHPDRPAQEDEFRAIDADLAHAAMLARDQGAVAWSLRIAITQARLWQRMDRRREAAEALRCALAALPQGHGDADPTQARALLDALSGDPP